MTLIQISEDWRSCLNPNANRQYELGAITQVELHTATEIALSTISEVLSGKRRFTKVMIAKLAAFFHVDKGLFAADF